MSNIYAIAGYKKYIPTAGIDYDECTKKWKQKVIKVCTPKVYENNHKNSSIWMNFDVGIAVVEKPYDFTDLTYRLHCSYVPNKIRVNYDEELDKSGRTVLFWGWGHTKHGRKPNDLIDHNTEYLHEAASVITTESFCTSRFREKDFADRITKKHVICVFGEGDFDSKGNPYETPQFEDNCGTRRMNNGSNPRCKDDQYEFEEEDLHDIDDYLYDDFRRGEKQNQENRTNKMKLETFTKKLRKNTTGKVNKSAKKHIIKSRRKGHHGGALCQNDHGGPLASWLGSELIVTGVALNSLYSSDKLCYGPSLFTSTACMSKFIKCLVDSTVDGRRQCRTALRNEGLDISEWDVDWDDY